MQKIDSSIALRQAILQLESTQAVEEKNVKAQFHLAYQSMKPINLIKSTFTEVAASQEIREKVLTTTVGLAAGFVSKKLFEGASHSPLRKLFGTALMFGITEVVAKNPEVVKAAAKGIFKIISELKSRQVERP
jgi:hypothetical protein